MEVNISGKKQRSRKPSKIKAFGFLDGTPGGIRTHGLSLRSYECPVSCIAFQCHTMLSSVAIQGNLNIDNFFEYPAKPSCDARFSRPN